MEGTKLMDNELYKAAMRGDSNILANAAVGGDECTETKANILHIAIRHEQHDFTKTALRKFSYLICQRNSDNNTPFHIAAEVGNTTILELLVRCYNKAALEGLVPWRMKNSKGDTPLHVALIFANLQFAEKLVIIDPQLTAFVNDSGETPLHLAIRYRVMDDDRESVLNAMKVMITSNPGGISTVQSPPKENSGHIITLLLEKNPSVTCLRDSNGLTPLLRAALFKTPDMLAIGTMLKYCPRSIEICDSSGKTFFHLLTEHSHRDNSEYLLSIEESIHSLKNRQDLDGNTPAHLAVKRGNIFMVQFLFRISTNFAIKNEEGVSAADLFRQQSDEFHSLLVNKQGENLRISWIKIDEQEEKLQNLLSMLREREIIDMVPDTDDQRRRGNVLHELIDVLWENEVTKKRALEDNYVQEFMKEALDSHPALICETNERGQTPLHQIAYYFPDFIDESVLRMFSHYFDRFEVEYGVEGLYLPPWRMKDKDGDTPLHTALIGGASLGCLCEFLKFDSDLVEYQNNEMETPLHLLSYVDSSATSFEEVKDLRSRRPRFAAFFGEDWNRDGVSRATCLYNKEGLTPLLNAAREADIPLVKLLYLLEPYDVDKKTKHDGKTFWHLLANQTPSDSTDDTEAALEMLLEICNYEKALKCLAEADTDGNTPLHIAIEKKNFQFAGFVMKITSKHDLENIMRKRNKKDLSPIDLIGSAEDVSPQFENFIWSKHTLMEILLGARSLYGFPAAMVKDYTNTIGVIAALLATITFTAAFTAPGGLNTNDGTPFLMRKAAFQVFMVSDILAMCLSMMILFCLLWTMGNQKKRVVILDLAIFLLQLSFYATLLAFMMGLWATTFPVASWIPIIACILCSLLILLMHKRAVIYAIPPVIIKTAFFSSKFISEVKEFLYLLLCCVPTRKMIRHSQSPNEIQKLELKLHKHALVKTWREIYSCDECYKLGSNWSFYCDECDFDLHPECALKNHEKDCMLSCIPKRILTCCSQPSEETNEVGGSGPTHDEAHSEQLVRPRPMWRAVYSEN